MKKHPFRWLIDADGDRIQIDRDIAPLIREIWDMGISTVNSCQDNRGYVWVMFSTPIDASIFLDAVITHGDVDLRHLASNPLPLTPRDAAKQCPSDGARSDSWLISVYPWGSIQGRSGMRMFVNVWFPRSHLAAVIDAVKIARYEQPNQSTKPFDRLFTINSDGQISWPSSTDVK